MDVLLKGSGLAQLGCRSILNLEGIKILQLMGLPVRRCSTWLLCFILPLGCQPSASRAAQHGHAFFRFVLAGKLAHAYLMLAPQRRAQLPYVGFLSSVGRIGDQCRAETLEQTAYDQVDGNPGASLPVWSGAYQTICGAVAMKHIVVAGYSAGRYGIIDYIREPLHHPLPGDPLGTASEEVADLSAAVGDSLASAAGGPLLDGQLYVRPLSVAGVGCAAPVPGQNYVGAVQTSELHVAFDLVCVCANAEYTYFRTFAAGKAIGGEKFQFQYGPHNRFLILALVTTKNTE